MIFSHRIRFLSKVYFLFQNITRQHGNMLLQPESRDGRQRGTLHRSSLPVARSASVVILFPLFRRLILATNRSGKRAASPHIASGWKDYPSEANRTK
ncbi:MAG: hypothetical protein LBQ54_04955 [Planctomycetaceae bacterium]|nr:hypothetical protein [Planctomycetaceae bacterium]